MAQDLFNNTSNNYIQPSLPECAGSSDSAYFEFLPGDQVGIVSGSAILAAMNLGDISQPVEGWVTQTKVLQPGEITYIAGLTKGISTKTQNFLYQDDPSVSLSSYTKFLTSADLLISYHNNFRYYQDISIHASGDYVNGISLDIALDMIFDAKGIKVSTTFSDPSSLIFTGTQEGYDFSISNIDVSVWDTINPSTGTYYSGQTLLPDTSSNIPAYKYPNGAMLGYVLKVTYPTVAGDPDRFVEINHVPGEIDVWTAIDVSILTSLATYTGVTVWDASCGGNAIDVSLFLTQATFDVSTLYTFLRTKRT
jgi:hypothetical protein